MGVSTSKNRFAVPEGLSANEYKKLAQKFAGNYKKMVDSTNELLNGINIANFKQRANKLREIANKEGFASSNPYIGCGNNNLLKKNEQLCTLVVIVVVLVTAFILLGCYMFMRGGMSATGTNRAIADTAYKP
jgi:hypothetical protein